MQECTMRPRRTNQATSFCVSSSGWDAQWGSSQTPRGYWGEGQIVSMFLVLAAVWQWICDVALVIPMVCG